MLVTQRPYKTPCIWAPGEQLGLRRDYKNEKITAATVASVGLVVGFGGVGVASASAYNWHNGHHHTIPAAVIESGNTTTQNETAVKLANNTMQYAATGSATIEAGQENHHGLSYHHDNGQSSGTANATTGSAGNAATASASIAVHNSAATPTTMPAIPEHTSVIKSGNTTLNNDTVVCVTNNTVQTATSGDATVEGNVSAGSATTGAATNTANASFTVSVNN